MLFVPHAVVAHSWHPAVWRVAALLVDEAGEIVLEGENCVNTEKDLTGHAETALVRAASKSLPHEDLAKLTL